MLTILLVAATQAAIPQTQLDAIAARGKLLWEYDQAAWHSTDTMVAKVPEPGKVLRGYIVQPISGGYQAIYYGLNGDVAFPVYTADLRSNRVVSDRLVPEAERAPLAPTLQRMIRARSVAAASGYVPCGSNPFNTVVIAPAKPNDPVEVYLLTPQPGAEQYSFGGHYRVRVSAAGKIADKRAFANSCLTMTKPPRGADEQEPAFFTITHLLDPGPTEIHVFNSLASRFPIVVAVSAEQLYAIDGDEIEAHSLPR